MAITLVPEATTSAPITSADWTRHNNLIAANEVPDLAFLTDWELTATEPLLKKGIYIYHAGNTYIVDTADEPISGTPAAGINYIEITLSGSTLTAAWVTVTTGYTYSPLYGGVYNGSNQQLLPDICYLSGTDYIRGRSFGMDYNFIHLADGNFIMASGIDTLGANITSSGGDIDTAGGDITTGSGVVNCGTGGLLLEGELLGTAPDGGTENITSSGIWVIPAGIYSLWGLGGGGSSWLGTFQWYNGSSWISMGTFSNGSDTETLHITLSSDGTNTRVTASAAGPISVRWVRL